MARRAPTTGMSPQMLKHFAAATLVLTICIAVFAEGEMGELKFDEAQARAQTQKAVEAEANKLGVRRKAIGGLTVAPRAASFGPDGGGDGDSMGADTSEMPADLAMVGPGTPMRPLTTGLPNDPGLPRALPPGMSYADFMTPGVDGKGRKRVGAPRRLSPAERAKILAAAHASDGERASADLGGD